MFSLYHFLYKKCFLYTQMSKDSSARYYQPPPFPPKKTNKTKQEKTSKKTFRGYQDLSEEETEKRDYMDANDMRQYGCKWYKNLPEDEKEEPSWV